MKPYMCNALFLLDYTCTFNTEIFALLEVFKGASGFLKPFKGQPT